MLTRALTVLALFALAGDAPPSDGPAVERPAEAQPVAKLRKLHLVRPDLIPYPLAYDVYC